MSSNQTKSERRKVRSIVKQLSRRNFRKRFFSNISGCILACVLVILTALAVVELAGNDGEFYNKSTRVLTGGDVSLSDGKNQFLIDDGDGNITAYTARRLLSEPKVVQALIRYRITAADGSVVLSKTVGMYVIYPAVFFALLMVIRFFLLLISNAKEKERIQYILSPLEEIALRADELSRLEFDEEKYLILEEKLDSLASDESLQISKGDKELERIEEAVNRLLNRMRESNMRQARFVNDASHELRTPIAVIEGYSNMLARWGKEDEKVLDEAITAIRNESAHMKYLVEQLLFLARGDSGKTVLHPENVNLSDMMREIYEESLMIDEKHIYRYTEAAEPLVRQCDPALMKQAVRILVDNAAKYTNEGDEILLTLGEDNGTAYLQVQDTGIGMEQADVAHMFERFYRADTARSYKGTGLGLSIAKWIVDRHGGHFEVTSRTGLGTRIRIAFN